MFVDENLGTDDAAKRLEHLNEIHVLHVVGEVVDEQIAAFWACICGVMSSLHHSKFISFYLHVVSGGLLLCITQKQRHHYYIIFSDVITHHLVAFGRGSYGRRRRGNRVW